MKMETFKGTTTEIYLQGEGVSVTVNPWANHEGFNVMMHGNDLSLRFAASMRWEDADMLIAAISVAKAQ